MDSFLTKAGTGIKRARQTKKQLRDAIGYGPVSTSTLLSLGIGKKKKKKKPISKKQGTKAYQKRKADYMSQLLGK